MAVLVGASSWLPTGIAIVDMMISSSDPSSLANSICFEVTSHVLLNGKGNYKELWRMMLGMFAIITTMPPGKPSELHEDMSKCVSVVEGWREDRSFWEP